MQPQGHGLIIEAPTETDYIFGSESKLAGEVINELGDWSQFAPVYEHQAPVFETSSCATQATLTAFEALHRFFYGNELNLSDRFLAKISGTDPQRGNAPQRVAQTFRASWSPYEEDWPMDGVKSVAEYYAEPPDMLYTKADVIRGDNQFGYDAITNPSKLKIQDALTKGAVCMSVPAWAVDERGVYYRPQNWRDNHYIWVRRIRPDGDYEIQDSYPPYIKQVRGDLIPEIAYRYVLNEEITDQITLLIRAIKAWLAKLV